MYDIWAVYSGEAEPYFLGKTVHGYTCPLKNIHTPADIKSAQEEAISFAIYRLIKHRFALAPRVDVLFEEVDAFFASLGYNSNNTSLDYTCSPAALGNYVAQELINFGWEDGSNEQEDYSNLSYQPVNEALIMAAPGNPNIQDLNRWQPLQLGQFIDQGGTITGDNIPDFLGPEWGQVFPFSLQEETATIYQRDGFDYWVYHDPGPPPYLDMTTTGGLSEEYKWGHSLVSIWSSHLDPSDGVMWDIFSCIYWKHFNLSNRYL